MEAILELSRLPVQSFWGGVGLLVVMLLLLFAARAVGRLREGLAEDGVLPRATWIAQATLRIVAAFFALGAFGALVPQWLSWTIPFAMAGAAIALGFFAVRDVLPDLLAGLSLLTENRVREGGWIQGPNYAGIVESVGLRTVWLRDNKGRRIAIPSSQLVHATITGEGERFPAIDIDVRIPTNRSPAEVRQLLTEAVAVSPWVAPGGHTTLVRDAADAERWRVRTRVLDGRFADQLEGSLRERVEEAVLATRHGMSPTQTGTPQPS